MLIGYARVSTADHTSALPLDALNAAGCERIFTDERVSGSALKRLALDKALKELGEKGIGSSSLTESIDTTSAQGRLLFHTMSALTEFERSLFTERTRASRAAARQRGVKAGRQPKLTPEKIGHAQLLISPGDVAKSFDVSLATLHRHMPAAASHRRSYDLFSRVTRGG